ASITGRVSTRSVERKRAVILRPKRIRYCEATAVIAELQTVFADHLGNGVVELFDLIDAWLRPVGAEAKLELLLAAANKHGRQAGARRDLRIDVEAHARGQNHLLRSHGLEVEPRPMR